MSEGQRQPGRRLAELDGLRGIAALSVLLYHAWLYTRTPVTATTRVGTLDPVMHEMRLGLVLFFVLSGFLLYGPWVAAALEGRARPRLGTYLLRRAARVAERRVGRHARLGEPPDHRTHERLDSRTRDAHDPDTAASRPRRDGSDRVRGDGPARPAGPGRVSPSHHFLRDVVVALQFSPDVSARLLEMPPAVLSVLEYVSAHYAGRMRLPIIAAVSSRSPRYLLRTFQRCMALSVKQFVTRVRVEVALYYLSRTDEKLDALAERVGFADASHLSRVLLRYTGRRPGECRSGRS